MSLFNELKRRNVFRVGIAYGVASWLFLQVVDFALDVIDAPNWIIQVLVLLAAVGLPAVLTFAWVFEMTPEGLKRESEIQRENSVTSHTASKLNKLTIVLLVAAILVVVIDRFVPESGINNEIGTDSSAELNIKPAVIEESAPAMPSVAVLPFANMSSDPDNEFFSDGISEELLNLLVQVDGLRVPSRTSSFAFKGKNMDIKEIARQLAVEHVLEGSVRKAGNQVRITAQLIDVKTDTHLWSNTYDRELENIFAIQDEISREIIRELKIALDTTGLISRDESRPTNNMQAYQDYLRGRYLFIQRGVPSLKASLAALQSAVTLDPAFTEAWAALSVTAGILSGWDPDNTDTTNQIALDAGNHALQLDENSATAMAGLGVLNYNKGKWQASLELLKRASVLSKDSNPTYFYGLILQTTGYISEASQAFLKAEQLDPIYPQLQAYLGVNAMTRGDMAAARVHFQRSIDGGNSNGVTYMYFLELEMGNLDSAMNYFQEASALAEAGLVSGYNKDSLAAISAAFKDPSQLKNGIDAAIAQQDIVTLKHFGAIPEIMLFLNNSLTNGELLNISINLGISWTPGFSGLRQLPEYKQFLTDIGLVDLWKERGWPDLCRPTDGDDFECE
jgi:TolB-like protein/Flp pilus assembly protein TadD